MLLPTSVAEFEGGPARKPGMTTAAGESESSRLRTACNQAHRVPDLTQAPYLRRNAERRRLTACSGAEAYTLFALAKPALPGSRSIGVPQRHLRVDNRPSGGHTAPQRPVGAMHDTRGGDGLVDVHLAEPYPLDTFPGKGEYSPPDRSQDTETSKGQGFSIRKTLSRLSGFGAGNKDLAELRALRIGAAELDFLPASPQKTSPSPFAQVFESLGDSFLVARLAVKLYLYLGLGWRWSSSALRLILYAILLLPGFAQMALFYFGSARVIRSITYGPNPRNRLDLYVPRNHWRMETGPRAVVIYITGGAWTIGYKAWGSLLGRRLSKQGVLVCCLDYRNFPQGTVGDMLEDVNTGIAWVLARCVAYGGDPERVYVVGQSCGAQLGTLALLTQAEQSASSGAQLFGGRPSWPTSSIKGLVGVSGVYNCHGLADHFDRQGLYRRLFERIMAVDGQPQLKLVSPTYCIKGQTWGHTLPPVHLLHGTEDTCAPVSNANQFAEALAEAGCRVKVKLYPGETHTSPLIENPMRGIDHLTDDILRIVTEHPGAMSRQIPLCPGFFIWLAAIVCPF